MFRSALNEVNENNFEASTIFGMIVSVYEWVSRADGVELFFGSAKGSNEEVAPNWIQLLHGSGKIIERFFYQIEKSPLAQIGSINLDYDAAAKENLLEQSKFDAIKALWRNPNGTEIPTDASEADIYDQALEQLQIFYTAMTAPKYDNNLCNMATAWLCQLDPYFFVLVSERKPGALLLLAHFTLLLNRVEDFWWIRGISRSLLKEISNTLGAERTSWLAWPMQDLVLCEFKKESGTREVQS